MDMTLDNHAINWDKYLTLKTGKKLAQKEIHAGNQ